MTKTGLKRDRTGTKSKTGFKIDWYWIQIGVGLNQDWTCSKKGTMAQWKHQVQFYINFPTMSTLF